MAVPSLLEGEIFSDHRGMISSLNHFSFDGVKRIYFIHHPDTSIIRGWHGHQFEKKWFYCVKGSFQIGLVEIDHWENPSSQLKPYAYILNETQSRILQIPEGYANCIKAIEKDSVLMVLSGKEYNEALGDSWRYDNSMWNDWLKTNL